MSLFPLLDPAKLLEEQSAEFGPYIEYLKAPTTVTVPDGETKSNMSHYFLNGNVSFRSYLPGCLRKRSSFHDQLVVPTASRKLVVHSCHGLPASGGHLAFEATFDKIQDRYWWHTTSKDVAKHVECCLSYQHRKTSHRPLDGLQTFNSQFRIQRLDKPALGGQLSFKATFRKSETVSAAPNIYFLQRSER